MIQNNLQNRIGMGPKEILSGIFTADGCEGFGGTMDKFDNRLHINADPFPNQACLEEFLLEVFLPTQKLNVPRGSPNCRSTAS